MADAAKNDELPRYAQLHREAMELCEQADRAQRLGQPDPYARDLKKALALEREAAALCPRDVEPTRSALHRSAASIAMQLYDIREAYRLVLAGLGGDDVIGEMRTELLDVLGADNSMRKVATNIVETAWDLIAFAAQHKRDDLVARRKQDLAEHLTHLFLLLKRS